MSNPINPEHYNKGTYEAINVIEAWGANFNLGNALKYICRAGKKEGNTAKQDLQKAVWYLEREIKRISKLEYKEPTEKNYDGLKGFICFPEFNLEKFMKTIDYHNGKPAVMTDPNYPDFVENASFEEKKYIPKSHENSLV